MSTYIFGNVRHALYHEHVLLYFTYFYCADSGPECKSRMGSEFCFVSTSTAGLIFCKVQTVANRAGVLTHKGSYMSARVLFKLLNEIGK